MPNRDQTGPEGEGPMTGRKQGKCTGNDQDRGDRGLGRGLGRGKGNGQGPGRGRGRGTGRGYGRGREQ